jgi:hypothetical protein
VAPATSFSQDAGPSLGLAAAARLLLAVLQFCADDLHTLFSAARVHSKLHQAAVMALSSLSVRLSQQQQADALLLYLSKHGQYINSMELRGNIMDDPVTLRQLPPILRLDSLKLRALHVQLQAGDGFQGLVRPGVPLKQLRLYDCTLLDREEGLAAVQGSG